MFTLPQLTNKRLTDKLINYGARAALWCS